MARVGRVPVGLQAMAQYCTVPGEVWAGSTDQLEMTGRRQAWGTGGTGQDSQFLDRSEVKNETVVAHNLKEMAPLACNQLIRLKSPLSQRHTRFNANGLTLGSTCRSSPLYPCADTNTPWLTPNLRQLNFLPVSDQLSGRRHGHLPGPQGCPAGTGASFATSFPALHPL